MRLRKAKKCKGLIETKGDCILTCDSVTESFKGGTNYVINSVRPMLYEAIKTMNVSHVYQALEKMEAIQEELKEE